MKTSWRSTCDLRRSDEGLGPASSLVSVVSSGRSVLSPTLVKVYLGAHQRGGRHTEKIVE